MNTSNNSFVNRRLLIVTKHEKERIIAPLFEDFFGVSCTIPKTFDTDSLGTFSGEIARKNDALTTLRHKCLEAMEVEGYDLAIATEGSFGSHPSVFFAAANDELIMLLDKKNNIEIVERVISLNTNFSGSMIHSKQELNDFLKKVDFPTHAVIIKDIEENWNHIQKGITSLETIENYFESVPSFFIETDMRALYNPTRMKIIEEVAKKLINKINSECPDCSFPGFSVVEVESGLVCSWCSKPTKSTLAHLYQCKKCNYQKKELFPNGKQNEDPMYCDFCNP